MSKCIFFSILLICYHTLQAQEDIKLPGVVVELNSKYRTGSVIYLSNAEIKSAGATPQRSDVSGEFTLVFADRPGGDVARIFAAKSGYELVNEEEMKQASVIGRLQRLKIVMCPKGMLYENQIAYYNIAKDASLEAYERKIAALSKMGREYEQVLAELRTQYNQEIRSTEEALAILEKERENSEKRAKEMADKWVTVNLDDESPAYQRAFAAFEGKNIELAKAILDSVDLAKRLELNSREKMREQELLDTLKNSIARRDEEIRQDLSMCLLKARLHKLDYEWAEAERFYDLAIAYDGSNWEVVFEAAEYLHSQNQFLKARRYYEKALEFVDDLGVKGGILNNLSVILIATAEFDLAKEIIEESLDIFRELAKESPDEYIPYVAANLINAGSFFLSVNDFIKSKEALEESLDIYRRLSENNPDAYLPDLAKVLSGMGVLFMSKNDFIKSKEALEESLDIYRRLSENNLDTYLPDLAKALYNMGNLLFSSTEFDLAQDFIEESLDIYRRLSENNPDAYLPDLAKILYSMGTLFMSKNDFIKSKEALEESLDIYRRLSENNPDAYLPDLARALQNMGTLLLATNEWKDANDFFEEAIEFFKLLAEKEPYAYNMEVVVTAIKIGLIYERLLNINRNLSIKNLGLLLIKDAELRLSIFDDGNPRVQVCKTYIQRLNSFFNDFK